MPPGGVGDGAFEDAEGLRFQLAGPVRRRGGVEVVVEDLGGVVEGQVDALRVALPCWRFEISEMEQRTKQEYF